MADEFKYLRALAAMYIRMTFPGVEVYELLEPLLKDYRKLRLRNMGKSGYSLTYIDEFVDKLLTEERVCDIILPRLAKREVLEETEGLAPRTSVLLNAMAGKSGSDDEGGNKARKRSESVDSGRSVSRGRSLSRSRSAKSKSKSRSRSGSVNTQERFVSKSPSRSRSRSRSRSVTPPRKRTRSPSPYRSRSRSVSPDRMDVTES
ncbi:unnamed protein product [Rhizoctonia solani]|uniref:Pre-mRNA-splicing factor 38 n=1 Tax=Rhizoctonia solani TaxID=456999 RepID=A0A8H3CY51_9AGAM|nr:unnamed protein product [Rhizoctonia solani]